MDSPKIRDLSVAGGIAAGVALLAYTVIDDIRRVRHTRSNQVEAAATAAGSAALQPMPGYFGDLHQVISHYHTGEPQYRYVRPATEREQKLCLEAQEIDRGDGVFAIGRDGVGILPDSPEWNAALAASEESLAYYRVS